MSGLFNVDSPIFVVMGKMCDMMVASLLWLVCALPGILLIGACSLFPSVLTSVIAIFGCGLAGPAFAALYYVMVKVIRRGRGYVFREFVHSYKQNFKVGYLATIIVIFVVAILFVDYQFAGDMENTTLGSIMFGAYVVMMIIIALMSGFLFPILSRFTLSVKGLFKNTFFMSFRHILTSLLLLVIWVAGALACFITVIGVVLIPAACALLSSFLIERVFKRYMPKPEVPDEESGQDSWYWE